MAAQLEATLMEANRAAAVAAAARAGGTAYRADQVGDAGAGRGAG